MAKDISGWLEGLDLGRYVEMFQANAIDLDLLPDLDEAMAAGERPTRWRGK